MGEKIIVGPVNKGLKNDVLPFNIDNDSFPTLINAYQWRGRVKRKRGTAPLTRLTRYFNSSSTSYTSIASITLDGTGSGNLLTGFSLQSNAALVPGWITIVDSTASNTYTDPSANGTLTGAPSGSGTIIYSTGSFSLGVGAAGDTITATFLYYPDLPVMGIEPLVLTPTTFAGTLAFDTTYSYNVLRTAPYSSYDVSFYKNPITATYPSYVQKTTVTPTSWNGENYQQFWTANYQGALWTTNGITVPFTVTNIGMQYKSIVSVTVTSAGPPATASLEITAHGLVVGDFVFVNEVATTTGINFQTGYVITVTDANNVIVEFPNATLATDGTGGIAQYLTNRSNKTLDCLRWYDGDPTDGNATSPTLNGHLGWVNFAPPLSFADYNIDELGPAQYYLVGARIILPFKDRLLFIGPVVQTSIEGSQIYLPDAVIYSQNGTPYYTASFTGSPTSATTVFSPILVPNNQSASPAAYFEDSPGFGGFIVTGISQVINTAIPNEDVIILGYSNKQARLVYTGNDIVPFNVFIINSEYGSNSTFSALTLDRGAISVGNRGIIVTSQVSTERIDLDIPDQVFQFDLTNNGNQRITAQRDFINEWIYFSYPSNKWNNNFPNQTLQYNYRDESWAIFNECYTTYGLFSVQTGYTWATIGQKFPTWNEWNEPWNSGSSSLLQPNVVGGNQQGYLILRDSSTGEANSLYIKNFTFPSNITGISQASSAVITVNNNYYVGQQITISGVHGMTQINGGPYTISSVSPTTVTIGINSTGFGAYTSGGIVTPTTNVVSPDHCLNNTDFIVINSCLGTISTQVNGKIFQVSNVSEDFFYIGPLTSSTYIGSGQIQRMYIPTIQTKQFPVSWGMARKTRLGPQQYLFTTTNNGQVTLQIFLSENAVGAEVDPYNDGPYFPDDNSPNNSLVYTNILYTCPESTNLGLTPANTNLQMVTANRQNQIWHRMNTSLLGDTVQIGFTLSEAQMRDTTFSNQFTEIELHGFILDVSPSQVLA